MKIAIIGSKGIPAQAGGIERHVEHLAQGLSDLGLEVFVYSRPWYTKSKQTNYNGISIVNLPSIKTKHLDAISHTFFSTIHAMFKNVDIIHFHGVGPSFLTWLPKVFKPKVKVVSTFHCIDRKHQKWGRFARVTLRMGEWCSVKFADKTICVSKTLKQYCQDVYDTETVYIPNGVNIPKPVVTKDVLQKYNLEPNKYVLMVTRLVRHKGAHYLIKAYEQLNNDEKLVIVGGSAFTDDYVKELNRLAAKDSRVILTGTLTGQPLYELFANAKLFVQPSESEGLPIAVLEALSFSRPVLVSNIPENLEAISRDKYGFSFKNKSIQDLKAKLEYLLDQPELLQQTGEKGKKFATKNYNWQDIVNNTINLYQSLLQPKEQSQKQAVKTV